MTVTIVIPTYNGASTIDKLIKAVRSQKKSKETKIIVVDSGSYDKTLSILAKYDDISVHHINKSEFNHGSTRNLGAEKADSDLIVFLTQDAIPAHDLWLYNLIKEFKDQKVVGVCSKIIPFSDTYLLKKIEVDNDLSGRTKRIGAEIKNLSSFDKLPFWKQRANYLFFHNISSAIRRKYLLDNPFPHVPFAEDVEFAKQALFNKKKIVFTPESRVYHAHEYHPFKSYGRNLIDAQYHTKYLDIKNVPQLRSAWKNVQYLVKRDFKNINKYPSPFGIKLLAMLYSPFAHGIEQLGQYRGTRKPI